MTAVRFARRGDTTAITFPYDPTVVATIKLVVPAFLRSWNPVRREWLILEPVYADELARVLRGAGHIVVGLSQRHDRDRDAHHHRDDHRDDAHHWARAVFARVGSTRASLAYRLLSKLCHPDHGGDHELQLELNQAYAELPDTRKDAS